MTSAAPNPEVPPSREVVAARLSGAAMRLVSDVLEGVYMLDESQRDGHDSRVTGGLDETGQTAGGTDLHDFVVTDGLVSYQQEWGRVFGGQQEVIQLLFVPVATDPQRRDNAQTDDRLAPGVTVEVIKQLANDAWQSLTLRQGQVVKDGRETGPPTRRTICTEYLTVPRDGAAEFWTVTHRFDEAQGRMVAERTDNQPLDSAATLAIGEAMLHDARAFVHRRYFGDTTT